MLNITLLWLIAGSILCLMELVFPSAFVEFMMGISAILVAFASLILPNSTFLVVLWLGLSTGLIVFSRRFLTNKRQVPKIREETEAETLTEIPAGKPGRVLYEGSSWRAKCEDGNLAIAPEQKVYVVRREGNTLIVLPANLLD